MSRTIPRAAVLLAITAALALGLAAPASAAAAAGIAYTDLALNPVGGQETLDNQANCWLLSAPRQSARVTDSLTTFTFYHASDTDCLVPLWRTTPLIPTMAMVVAGRYSAS